MMDVIDDIDISIDERKISGGVTEIVAKIRPSWSPKDIRIKRQHGGYLNIVLKVFDSSANDADADAVIIKILQKSSSIADHLFVRSFLKWLSGNSDGLINLICCFNNGYVFRYNKGEVPNSDDMKNGKVIRKLFEKLHQLHQVPIPEDIMTKNVDSTLYYMESILKALSTANAKATINAEKRFVERELSWDKVMAMLYNTKSQYTKFVAENELVVCHMDPRIDNIIHDEESGDVNLVDWELACIGSEIMDISAFFIRDPTKKLEEVNMLPGKNEEILDSWLLLYLKMHPKYGSIADQLFPDWKDKMLLALDIMHQFILLICIDQTLTANYELLLSLSLLCHDKWKEFQHNYKQKLDKIYKRL